MTAARYEHHNVTWFEDLTPYTYLRSKPTNPPTLNVGWLSQEHEFAKGKVPERFVTRLEELRIHSPTQQTRGLHACELCPDLRTPQGHLVVDKTRMSSNEIRAVGADGTRYAAPSLILHYVAAHEYAPPHVFIEAVLRMQSLTWENAEANQVCMSCGIKLSREHFSLGATTPPVPYFSCPGCATSYWHR